MTKNKFSNDVEKFGSYEYSLSSSLSGKLSNHRVSSAMFEYLDCKGKDILDIGCGDGVYTLDYIKAGANTVLAIDPVETAIKAASEKYKDIKNLTFECHDIYDLTLPKKYDIAILRGVIHHTPDMKKSIAKACSLANEVVVMEPNGYNPVLKIIEKVSPYHIEHGERSFSPSLIRKVFKESGGVVLADQYVNLVPFFCPDWLAKLLKVFEPFVESIPGIKQLCCGQYIIHIKS